VKTISELLKCDQAKLQEAFTFRSIVVRGETSKIPLNSGAVFFFFKYSNRKTKQNKTNQNKTKQNIKRQAKDNRDSVSKSLYSRFFDWVVDYINESIKPTTQSVNFIGVLDIFGFELFKVLFFFLPPPPPLVSFPFLASLIPKNNISEKIGQQL